jgi:hypothetical protein
MHQSNSRKAVQHVLAFLLPPYGAILIPEAAKYTCWIDTTSLTS